MQLGQTSRGHGAWQIGQHMPGGVDGWKPSLQNSMIHRLTSHGIFDGGGLGGGLTNVMVNVGEYVIATQVGMPVGAMLGAGVGRPVEAMLGAGVGAGVGTEVGGG